LVEVYRAARHRKRKRPDDRRGAGIGRSGWWCQQAVQPRRPAPVDAV